MGIFIKAGIGFWFLACLLSGLPLLAQTDTALAPKVPFDGMDVTWANGQNRQKTFPLTFGAISGMAYIDSYYNFNFAQPIDNTQTVSATVGRHNEFTVNHAILGLETNYQNAIGRLSLQTGSMLALVQDQDPTVARGRNLYTNNLRNIREATAGYHFDKGYGLNFEMGIFMSYIGLESYTTQENWNYQRTMLTEYTPFYFSGGRVQYYPNKKYKMEYWLMNGWQSYGKWNQAPGVGTSQMYRPNENLHLVGNAYLGTDTRQQSQRIRFHHDHSVLYRYYRNKSGFISQAAFSINNHIGFEAGGPQTDRFTGEIKRDKNGNELKVTPSKYYFLGTSISHRLWFDNNKLALSTRVDMFANGGYYISDNPGPYASRVPDYRNSQILRMAQGTVTFDIMPTDHFTLRLEYVHRISNIPYFAGHGGTTSPTGYNDVPVPDTFIPDQVKTENRVTLAANIRI